MARSTAVQQSPACLSCPHRLPTTAPTTTPTRTTSTKTQQQGAVAKQCKQARSGQEANSSSSSISINNNNSNSSSQDQQGSRRPCHSHFKVSVGLALPQHKMQFILSMFRTPSSSPLLPRSRSITPRPEHRMLSTSNRPILSQKTQGGISTGKESAKI